EKRAADDAVADVQLVQVRDGANLGDVDVIDAVTGIDHEAKRVTLRGADAESLEFVRPRGGVIGVGVGAGVQFDPRSAQLGGEIDLMLVGIDEQTRLDAGGVHRVGAARDLVAVFHDVEAAFGGNFFAAFGYKAY